MNYCVKYLENILGEMSKRLLNIRTWNAEKNLRQRFENWKIELLKEVT